MLRPLRFLVRCALLLAVVVSGLPVRPTFAQIADPQPTDSQQSDARMFSQTGYRIGDDKLWSYFKARGGVRTFGYPVSNPFTLQGFRIQIFQRAVLQLQPTGSVGILNVLDDILPYTAINGSQFPAADPSVIGKQPKVGEAGYHERALQFVRDNAPDEWQGQKVNFYQTFIGSVRADDAFPNGGVNPGLLQGFNLEIWGLPTSKPTADPTNANFVYQRFQRGIMHYDAGCKCTQGLLLADYVKSLLTLRNLPPDLAAQAVMNPLYGQVDPLKAGWVRRPGELPASDLTDSFIGDVSALSDGRQGLPVGQPSSITLGPVGSQPPVPTPGPTVTPGPAAPAAPTPPPVSPQPSNSPPAGGKPTIFVDAGHGGKEIGASFTFDDGATLIEKQLNLKVATRLAQLLTGAGFGVVTSRTVDAQVNGVRDLNNDGKVNLTDDLQARVDAANSVKADLLISVHFNGIDDPTKRGTQTFYSEGRTFSGRNVVLAELVQASLLRNIRGAGYDTLDRGATNDSKILGQGSHYYLLGPESPTIRRPSEMPGIIGEALFVTSSEDAKALRQDKVLDGVARGYFEAIKAYFERFPK
ncbi:MAG: N-acetylmuramoyl-L-alanine amidase [Chloroflexi bacterium]|nr:N-acetylmuramoyl-L-alanine amidase [Chloroflexota bacterium]